MARKFTHRSSARRQSHQSQEHDKSMVHSVAHRDNTSFAEHITSLSGITIAQGRPYRSSTSSCSVLSGTTAVDERVHHSHSVKSVHQTRVPISDCISTYRNLHNTSDANTSADRSEEYARNETTNGWNARIHHQRQDFLGIGAWTQDEITIGPGLAMSSSLPMHKSQFQDFNTYGRHYYGLQSLCSWSEPAVGTENNIVDTSRQQVATQQVFRSIDDVYNHFYYSEDVLDTYNQQDYTESFHGGRDMMQLLEESVDANSLTYNVSQN